MQAKNSISPSYSLPVCSVPVLLREIGWKIKKLHACLLSMQHISSRL
jgi:hypothetical protein